LKNSTITYYLTKAKTKIQQIIHGKKAPYPDEIIYIDPNKIMGHMDVEKNGWNLLKKATQYNGYAIVGGDWDLDYVTYVTFKELDLYKSCYEHWVMGKPWSQTSLYHEYVEKLEKGIPNRFSSLEELQDRYETLDRIYQEINEKQTLSTHPDDLIKISIDRNGNLIWGPNGRHRICMALCAGLKSMPGRVGFVHASAVDKFQIWHK